MSAVEPVRATLGLPGATPTIVSTVDDDLPVDTTAWSDIITDPLAGSLPTIVFQPPVVPLPLVGSLMRLRLRYVGMAAITAGALAVTLVAPLVHVRPGIHELALLGHLIALAVGFGAVLAVDWFGVLWMLRRRQLTAVLQVAHGLHTLIWLGLFGLVATGCLLAPHLSSPLTRIKLVAVLIVAVNGLFVDQLQNRLAALGDGKPTGPLLMRATVTALISQLCWWTAIIVGFLNTQS